MDKQQGLYNFWSQFGVPAYDENYVPDTAVMPYITYQTIDGSLDEPVYPSGSIWSKSWSWNEADAILHNIEDTLKRGGQIIELECGKMWVTRGTPFAQRMGEEGDDSIKRNFINLAVEYFTE